MHVVVTGANRGIGAELLRQYDRRGDKVIGTSRKPVAGLKVADVTSAASLAELAKGVDVADLLVCNAGIYADKGMALDTGYAPDIWADTFAVNVTGVFLTIQAFLPALARSQNGRIAILSSIMASSQAAPGGAFAYRASKAAALNLGRNMATELRPRGISVGIYHPGWVRTDMGGGSADIDVSTAAAGLIDRFDALGPDNTGEWVAYDGRPMRF